MDVTANQEEISNHETFQLEFDPKAAKWAIRTMQDKYFRWELLDIYNINNSKQYYKQQYYAPIPKKCSPNFFPACKPVEVSKQESLDEPTQLCLTSPGWRMAPSPSRRTTASLSAPRSLDTSLPTLTLWRSAASM